MNIYEVKRREFEILEEIDASSKKLERKGKLFLLKHYDSSNEMDKAFRINKVFISNGIQVPQARFLNKKTNDIIYDFIDSYPVLEDLQYGDLCHIQKKRFTMNFLKCIGDVNKNELN